jgi:hypothetical protein
VVSKLQRVMLWAIVPAVLACLPAKFETDPSRTHGELLSCALDPYPGLELLDSRRVCLEQLPSYNLADIGAPGISVRP